MSKASLIRALARGTPAMKRSGPTFYFEEAQFVLRGFAIDAPPSRTTVASFMILLTDKIEFLHLGLGEVVLERGPLGKGASLLAGPILEALAEDEIMANGFDRRPTIDNYIERHLSEGAYPRWCQALLYCQDRQFDRASTIFEELVNFTRGGNLFGSTAFAEITGLLDSDPDRIPQTLDEWKAANMRAFGLKPRWTAP